MSEMDRIARIILMGVVSIPRATSIKRIATMTEPMLNIAEYTILSKNCISENLGKNTRERKKPGIIRRSRNATSTRRTIKIIEIISVTGSHRHYIC
jgi:hypothetical protein